MNYSANRTQKHLLLRGADNCNLIKHMKSFQFTIDGRKYETTVNEIEDNIAEVTVNGTVFHVAIDKKKTTPSIQPAAPKAAAAAPAAPLLHLGTALHGAPDRGSLRNAGRTVGIQRVCDDQKDRR